MTVRTILQLGNPALYQPSIAAADPCHPSVKALVADMRDTLEHVNGIGLAAPQIGVLQRVVLYALPENRIPQGAAALPIPWTPMISPAIEPLSTHTSQQWERCLSLPGLYAKVPRFDEIRIRFFTPEGCEVVQEWQGYVAKLLSTSAITWTESSIQCEWPT